MKYFNFEELKIKNRADLITFIIGVPAFCYLLYVNFLSQQEPLIIRSAVVGLALVVVFLRYPSPIKKAALRQVVDLVHIALTIFCFGYLFIEGNDIVMYRLGGEVNFLDKLVYLPIIYLLFEATRRTTGWAFTIVATVLVLYTHFGHLIPGFLGHTHLTFDQVAEAMVLNVDGVFGATTHAHITMIWFFLIFGTFLATTGAGSGFINFAFSLVGGMRGGAGQAAVVSSLLYGTVSGSGVASVATMGTFTIPLMKQSGYKPSFAGGVEAATAMGAQVTPPVLGGTAFLISALTGITYISLVKVTAPISLLYFFSMFLTIYFEAGRMGLFGLPKEQIPPFNREVVMKALIPLSSIVIMIILLVMGYTPRVAGVGTTVWVILLAISQKKIGMRMNPAIFLKCLSEGFHSGASLCAILATAGACVAAVNTTGLGMKFAAFIVEAGQSGLLLAIFFVMLASLLLGMGLPTPACYIILAILAGPALIKLGMPVLSAHMLIFYYGVFAGLTPPVGIAFMTAAGIAGAKQLETGWQAVKIAFLGLLIPVVWTYKPVVLLSGSLWEILYTYLMVAIGMVSINLGFVGYSFKKGVNIPLRALFIALGLLTIFCPIGYQAIVAPIFAAVLYIHEFGFTTVPIKGLLGGKT
ncbi:MAG: TRAP transporter fused permease subunit [Syntrophales bacterium]|jgi:TRAP transporter 4TM/12TM fusion protein|nr:TRAP transporter fused permease subunit [Syntrophales bacterium]